MVKMPKSVIRAVLSRTARFLYCICSILSRIFLFFLSKSRRTRCGSLCCKKCRKTLRQRRFAQFLLFFTKRKSASRNKTSLSVLPIFPSGLPASFTISLQSVRILPTEPVMNGGFLSRFPKRAAQLQLQTKES